MGLSAYYLGDTSALARRGQPAVAERLDPLLEAGVVARCTPTDLEAGFSSQSPADQRMRDERAAWPFIAMDQRAPDRAVEVQDALAARSEHRGAKIADLLIAAAEAAGLVVLHYDHHFDLIATVTGQDVDWIVRPGSVSWRPRLIGKRAGSCAWVVPATAIRRGASARGAVCSDL